MRTTPSDQITHANAATYSVHFRVRVQNGSGTWKDLSDLEGYNWCVEADWGEDIDNPVADANIILWREGGDLSLAPLDQTSALNVLDDGVTYSPLLDVGRRVAIDVATLARDAVPGDWVNAFAGYVDGIEWPKGQESRVRLTCRDLGALLVDTWIETERTYGSDVGVAIETVMQSILTDNATGVTLWVPSSPGFLISPAYTQQRVSVMDAVRQLAQVIGWDVRYRWNESAGEFQLCFYEPDRAKTTPDHTFAASQYFDVTDVDLSVEGVRNAVRVSFTPSGDAREFVEVSDASSITRYGRRYMEIAHADDSPINTTSEATEQATAALADLKDPKSDIGIELLFWWAVEMGDLYRFASNSITWDSDQDRAVVSYRHRLSMDRHRTEIQTRGTPAGAYLDWLEMDTRVTGGVTYIPDGVVTVERDPTTGSTYCVGAPSNPASLSYRVRVAKVAIGADGWEDIAFDDGVGDEFAAEANIRIDLGSGYALSTTEELQVVYQWYDTASTVDDDQKSARRGRAKRTSIAGKASSSSPRKPSVSFSIPQSTSFRAVTATIEDPDKVCTLISYQVKVGANAFGGISTSWDSSSGTPGSNTTLVRTKNVTVARSHNSEFILHVAYTIGGSALLESIPLVLDFDVDPNISGFSIGFNSSNQVVISEIVQDDDCAAAYVTVKTDGSTPADPTAGSNDGSIDFTVPHNSTITTSVVCDPGSTAKVKIRGASSTGALGVVRPGQKMNPGLGTGGYFIDDFSASGDTNGTGCTAGNHAMNRVSYRCTAPADSTVTIRQIVDSGLTSDSEVLVSDTTLSRTNYQIETNFYKAPGTLDVAFQYELILKDSGGVVRDRRTAPTFIRDLMTECF